MGHIIFMRAHELALKLWAMPNYEILIPTGSKNSYEFLENIYVRYPDPHFMVHKYKWLLYPEMLRPIIYLYGSQTSAIKNYK